MTTFVLSTSGGSYDGTSGNDVIIGKSGDDIIDGGAGADVLLGGAGNDIIVYDEFDIKVDGGTGYDTLIFKGTGQSLDLGLQKTVMNFERIDLFGGGYHTLTFSSQDVVRTSDIDSLLIHGDDTSHVNFSDSGWAFQGYGNGLSKFGNGSAIVYIDNAVYVTGFSGNASLHQSGATSVTEDLNPDIHGNLVASGTISVSDPNAGQSMLLDQVVASNALGSLTLGPGLVAGISDGTYSYTVANSAVQYLAADQQRFDIFTVKSVDGTPLSLLFTITGVNDAPVRQDSTSQTGSVTEITDLAPGENATNHLQTGSFVVRDVDKTDVLSWWVSSPDGHRGELIVTSISAPDANGDRTVNWQYSITDAAMDNLREGSSLENYTLHLSDRAMGTADAGVMDVAIAINLQGSNDALQLLSPSSSAIPVTSGCGEVPDGSANENVGFAVLENFLRFTDADVGDSVYFWADSPDGAITGPSVTFFRQFDGSIKATVKTLVPDAALDYLSKNQQLVQDYKLHFSDRPEGTAGASEIVMDYQLTFIGANDAPVRHLVAGDVTSGSVTELASGDPNANSSTFIHHATGSFQVQDVDLNDSLTTSGIIRTSAGTTYGNLVVDNISAADTSGIRTVHWTYSVSDHDLDPLPAGSGPAQTFAISLTDNTATLVQNVSIALNGAADGPAFAGNLTGLVVEFGQGNGSENIGSHTFSGTITASQMPAGDLAFRILNSPGDHAFGSFSATGGSVDTNGNATIHWTYTVADCLLDNLGGGFVTPDAAQLEIYHTTDPSITQRVTMSLKGANDDPFGPEVAFFDTTGQNSTFTTVNAGPFQVYGNGGDDILTAGANALQSLFGGDGNDTFNLNAGSSLCVGDLGADRFAFGSGTGTSWAWGQQDSDFFDIRTLGPLAKGWAMDFTLGQDHIDVSGTPDQYSLTLMHTTTTNNGSASFNPYVTDGTAYYALTGPNTTNDTITFNIIGSALQATDLPNILV